MSLAPNRKVLQESIQKEIQKRLQRQGNATHQQDIYFRWDDKKTTDNGKTERQNPKHVQQNLENIPVNEMGLGVLHSVTGYKHQDKYFYCMFLWRQLRQLFFYWWEINILLWRQSCRRAWLVVVVCRAYCLVLLSIHVVSCLSCLVSLQARWIHWMQGSALERTFRHLHT